MLFHWPEVLDSSKLYSQITVRSWWVLTLFTICRISPQSQYLNMTPLQFIYISGCMQYVYAAMKLQEHHDHKPIFQHGQNSPFLHLQLVSESFRV